MSISHSDNLAFSDFTRNPIYGYIEIKSDERSIIDHPPFQRLRRLSQLHIAHYTYHSVTHTRFTHSLGVMHIVGLFAKLIP